MSITQETAFLVETLARAASQIGSTDASKKINATICGLLPDPDGQGNLEDSLRQDNIALQEELASLQTSARIGAENLEIVRGKLADIHKIVFSLLETAPADEDGEKLEDILKLAATIDA